MLTVGFSRLDVTPPLGSDVSGYFVRRIADGMLDPLYLNTVAIKNGDETLLLMAIDYIGIKIPIIDKIRACISERTGVAIDHIMVAALHQHTSPCLEGSENPRATALKDPIFLDVVIRKFADGAQIAIDDCKEATMSTALTEVAEPIAFIRRYFTDKGVQFNPNTDACKLLGRCAESDNSVRLVRFHREGANDIAIINFSTHPDVIGGSKWSADWPGFTRRFVEEGLGDVSTIFFTGTQGDSNHVDFYKPKNERLKGTTYQHSAYMGRMVADAVIAAWDKTEIQTEDRIYAENRIVYNKTNIEGIEYYDDAVEYARKYDEQATPGNWSGVKISHPYIQSIPHARRIVSLRKAPIFLPVPLTLISIGRVVMVGFGGEAFTSYSRILKKHAPDKFLMTAVCANGYEGYLPTAEAFAQGGYEAISSIYTPELENQIVEATTEMLDHADRK